MTIRARFGVTWLRCAALALALLPVACSGGGSSAAAPAGAQSPVAAPALAPVAVPSTAPVDDWTTFAHDQRRTGYQAQATGISAANVGTLAERWSVSLGEPIKASPLVAGGIVYVVGEMGTVRALSATTGATVWQTTVGSQVQMSPTLADGLLFVGTHGTPATFVALDAATGEERWSAALPGADRSEPVVINGVVYVGDASGDEPLCNQGAIHGFSEMTGAPVFLWHDDPTPHDGGGIWGPLSTDGTSLYFGTGNTCSPNVSDANAAVKLGLSGSVAWAHNEADTLSDDDFGSSLTLVDGLAMGTDKNGEFFAFDAASGTVAWSLHTGSIDGYGAIGSPSTDGSVIVTDGGYLTDPTKTSGDPGGALYGLSPSGAVVWKIRTTTEVFASGALNNGIAFVSMNDGIFALDEHTGKTLWSHAFGAGAYPSAAVVPSGVYDADNAGNVYAFALGASTQPSAMRRPQH